MSKIAFVRHGESQWNKKGLWTGWTDIPLSKKGEKEARLAGKAIKDITFHLSFTSDLMRAWQTLEIIKKELQIEHIPSAKHQALKERHYGEFTGKNKWDIQKIIGETKFKIIRRGWDEKIAGGETLKDVYARVVPYFQKSILPHLVSGKNVMVVAHGNSIRALIKYLDNYSDNDISQVEVSTGEVVIYDLDKTGHPISKGKRTEKKMTKRKPG